MAPSVAAALSAPVLELARERGLDVRALRRTLGPRAAERVPRERHRRLLADVTRALDEPAVPVLLAERARLESYGLFGVTILSSPDGRSALDALVKYAALLTGGQLEVVIAAGTVTIRRVGDPPLDLGARLSHERELFEILASARQLFGDALGRVRATFRHRAPADTRAHERFVGGRIDWGAREDSLVLSESFLTRRLAPHAKVAEFVQRHAERSLPGASGPARAADLVRDALWSADDLGAATQARVAERLGLSERSLRRRLELEGTSFRALADAVRRSRAEQLLAGGASVQDVALALGFSEPSAFARAFKRWSGTSPRGWRRAR